MQPDWELKGKYENYTTIYDFNVKLTPYFLSSTYLAQSNSSRVHTHATPISPLAHKFQVCDTTERTLFGWRSCECALRITLLLPSTRSRRITTAFAKYIELNECGNSLQERNHRRHRHHQEVRVNGYTRFWDMVVISIDWQVQEFWHLFLWHWLQFYFGRIFVCCTSTFRWMVSHYQRTLYHQRAHPHKRMLNSAYTDVVPVDGGSKTGSMRIDRIIPAILRMTLLSAWPIKILPLHRPNPIDSQHLIDGSMTNAPCPKSTSLTSAMHVWTCTWIKFWCWAILYPPNSSSPFRAYWDSHRSVDEQQPSRDDTNRSQRYVPTLPIAFESHTGDFLHSVIGNGS